MTMQHLHSDINNISKLSTYNQFRYSLESDTYIDAIKWKRHTSAFQRFRCRNHHLAIETQHGKKVRGLRFRKLCLNFNIMKIEDEFHFLWYALFMNMYDIIILFLKYR